MAFPLHLIGRFDYFKLRFCDTQCESAAGISEPEHLWKRKLCKLSVSFTNTLWGLAILFSLQEWNDGKRRNSLPRKPGTELTKPRETLQGIKAPRIRPSRTWLASCGFGKCKMILRPEFRHIKRFSMKKTFIIRFYHRDPRHWLIWKVTWRNLRTASFSHIQRVASTL